jgi:hypothetical protein
LVSVANRRRMTMMWLEYKTYCKMKRDAERHRRRKKKPKKQCYADLQLEYYKRNNVIMAKSQLLDIGVTNIGEQKDGECKRETT